MLSWVSLVLGWALKCLAQGHSHEKTQRIQCGLNPGPLDYESSTLPMSHVGPLVRVENTDKYAQLHTHTNTISEQYLQKCRSIALDNDDLVKFTSSRGDNSATNDSMVMKIAHAELCTTSNIVCNFELSTCNTVGLFFWTTIIQ